MANRWGNNEMVRYFIFLGSKITADGDCSHEIKRLLLLGRNGEGKGNPLQHFGLENSLNRGAGQAIVHDITESDMTVQFSLF